MHSYEEALKQDPKSAAAYEGAVRSYLKLDMVPQAWITAQEGLKQAPGQSLTHSAMGEVLFRKAKIEEAQHEFITAYNLSDRDARAPYGLYRVYRSASYYGKAKQMLETAHSIDPEDRDIQRSWMAYQPRKERIQWLEKQAKQEPDKKEQQDIERFVEFLKAAEKSPHACKLASSLTETQVPLELLMPDPKWVEGIEMKVIINGKSMNLQLDTGASGIFIKRGPAGAAGLVPALETRTGGIGNEGTVRSYFSYADSIKVGALEFQNCIVDVTESTNRKGRQILPGVDGLIGADVFASYLVSIDFPGQKITLKPLPKNPTEPPKVSAALTTAGELSDEDEFYVHDRYVVPEMRNYSPFFRFGHDILIPTMFGQGEPKLFIVDSGASESFVSPEVARGVTTVRTDMAFYVEGIGGRVNNVQRVGHAVLRFGHVAQDNLSMLALDTTGISDGIGVEIGGLLGYTALGMMQVDIDYRDGLINFTYDPKKYRRIMQHKPAER